MPLKIRLEVSSLATKNISGVGQYIRLLATHLSQNKDIQFNGAYFNFLNRQLDPDPIPNGTLSKNQFIPLRIYAKLQSHKLAPAFDVFLPKVDLTIFPNFALWPTLKSKKKAAVIHDLTYIHFPEVVEKNNLPHLKRVVPRAIKKADFIITVSESVKKELVEIFGINPDRCVVTPIPPDKAFFTEVSKDDIKKVRTKYGLDPHKEYIYFIGNREPRKNLSTLVKAYELLPTPIKNKYPLVIAGGKGWKTAGTDAAIEQAIQNGNTIHTIGYIQQSDSPALFQGAKLFVMPSLYEGFGMPVVEAFASGTPVVASDIPVLREVGQETATYAAADSPSDFAKAIELAINKTSSRTSLQQAARRYSWQDNVQKIIDQTKVIS